MHVRNQKKTQIIFMDIDLIINSKSIGSQQTHGKRVTSNRSPRDHCIENQNRERKPSNYCLRTHRSTLNYSRIIGEAPMRMMNPYVMVSRLGLVVSGTCGSWNCFSLTPLGFLEYWGIYRAKRRCGRRSRWAQATRARLGR